MQNYKILLVVICILEKVYLFPEIKLEIYID